MAKRVFLGLAMISFALALLVGQASFVSLPSGWAHFFRLNFSRPDASLSMIAFPISEASPGEKIEERLVVKLTDFYDIGIYCAGEQASGMMKFSGRWEVAVSSGTEVLSRREITKEKARYFGPNKFISSDLMVLDTVSLTTSQGSDAYLVSIAVVEGPPPLCNGELKGFVRASQRP